MTDLPPSSIIPSDCIHSGPVDLAKAIKLDAVRGQTILITGGASGLGAALARHWAGHGANLIIGDIDVAKGTALVKDLTSANKANKIARSERETVANRTTKDETVFKNDHQTKRSHYFLFLDVTDWNSQMSFFEEAVRLSPHGGIDCVVANAGVNLSHETIAFEHPQIKVKQSNQSHGEEPRSRTPPCAISPPPKFDTLAVNLTGVLYTAHLAQAYLAKNPGSSKHRPEDSISTSGTISMEKVDCASSGAETTVPGATRDRHLLLIGSLGGILPLPTQSLYSISKHALVGLFRNLRLTCPINHGIRVNMICPYFFESPLLGIAGRAIMAGGALTRLEDVVEAADRLTCDRGCVGRALGVGINAGADIRNGRENGKGEAQNSAEFNGDHSADTTRLVSPLIDLYAHDFEQSDIFGRRMLALTNLAAGRRSIWSLLADLLRAILGGLLSLMWK